MKNILLLPLIFLFVCFCFSFLAFLYWLGYPSYTMLNDLDIFVSLSSLFCTPVQFSSVTQSCLTLCDPMNCSMPDLSVHHQLPEFTQTHIESVMPSSHLFLCCPLFLLPPIPPSIRVFSNESTLCMSGQSTGVSALASFLPKKSQG